MENDTIYVLISDLNYESLPDAVAVMSRRQFWKMRRFDGRFLRERISPGSYAAKCGEIQREAWARAYSAGIQRKYGVGKDWKNNRWFVEQVRPTL